MDFYTFLSQRDYLLLDGAMGTMLFAAGLMNGASPELWNVEQPERVAAVHQAYVDAGSDIILTNSFGGTAYRLKLHELQDRVVELNCAAAHVARTVADKAGRPVLVAGSMGPTGELLEPMGNMSFAQCQTAFADQARGLADGGADILWIETMSDLNEVKAAFQGARSVSALPIVATLSFDTRGRTMMGITGTQAAETMRSWGVAAIGANCGHNLPDTLAAIAQMHAADPSLILIAKANAGIPEWVEGGLLYSGTPEVMGSYAVEVRRRGARLIGACCGSSPAHIQKMAEALTKGTEDSALWQTNGVSEVEAVSGRGRRRLRS
ncbi:MAG: betaine--homocysteine S-methyltransferase [Chloroflexi bacterium]|nr:betaine--homocysteine S-methyltransferase [Chloroflexota bacterium]MBP8055784.1 betaine--homocysteine S-methyltransferase [Chloroflexota bacterium]